MQYGFLSSATGVAVAAALCLATTSVQAETIHGSGSTAAAKLYLSWGEAYASATGNRLVYDAVGSSAGVRDVIAGKVDFGATDVPLSLTQMRREGLICIPTVITGIVPAINLPGVAQGRLHLTGQVLADILRGQIRQWNDEAIQALNPGMRLPSESIKVVARQDGSGSTGVISQYLSVVSASWKQTLGEGSLLHWPQGTLLAKGSSGMAEMVHQTPYSIGYVEPGYITAEHLNYARVENKAGKYVEPAPEGFRAALAGSRWTFEGHFEDSLSNRDDPKAWPITTGTFIVLRQKAQDRGHAAAVANFFVGAFMHADDLAPKAGFVPLPEKTQARAVGTLGTMIEPNGQPLTFDVMWRKAIPAQP